MSFMAYLRAGILSFKENNDLNQCQKTLSLPPISLPSMSVVRFPASSWDALVSSESQMFVFSSLKMKMKVNCRGSEQLRGFSIGGQLHQLKHRMVPVQDNQVDTCQIGLS